MALPNPRKSPSKPSGAQKQKGSTPGATPGGPKKQKSQVNTPLG